MKKKILSILLASMLIIMAFCSIPVGAEEETRAVSVYTGIDDYDFWDTALESDSGEVTIMTADQLMAFAVLSQSYNFEGWTIKLGADMVINTGDASTWGTEAPTYTWKCSTTWTYRFAGNFDGQGHVVSGLYSKYDQECGLFGTITGGNTIENVSVVNSYFEYSAKSSGNCLMGGIVGYIDSNDNTGKYDNKTTTIKNVYVNATLYTDCDVLPQNTAVGVGGIVGYAGNTSIHSFVIENAVFEGNITSMYRNTGGLVGGIMVYTSGATTIRGCSVNANITSNVTINEKADGSYVGGLLGYLSHTSLAVNDCIVEGKIQLLENKYSSAFIGRANPCADTVGVTYRRFNASNVLLAVTPVPTGENSDVIFGSMLFDHNFTGSVTVNFNNIKYDSSLYSYPAEMPHINRVGGGGEVANEDFEAAGATTETLKGQEVFNYWMPVSGAYPIPAGVDAPVIDMEFYKNAVDVAPSTPDGDGGNNDDNGGSNNGSTDNGGSNNNGSTDNGGATNNGSNNNNTNNGSNNNSGSDNNDGTSNTDTTDNTPTTDTTSEKTGGCFASVGFAGISLLALVAVATIAISKKKVRN